MNSHQENVREAEGVAGLDRVANPQKLVRELLLNLARRLRLADQQLRKLDDPGHASGLSAANREALKNELAAARHEAWNSFQAAKAIWNEHEQQFDRRHLVDSGGQDGGQAQEPRPLDPASAFADAVRRYELSHAEMTSSREDLCRVMSTAIGALMPPGTIVGSRRSAPDQQEAQEDRPWIARLAVLKGADRGCGRFEIASDVEVRLDDRSRPELATWVAHAFALNERGERVSGTTAAGGPDTVQLSSHVVRVAANDTEQDTQQRLADFVRRGLDLVRQQAQQRVEAIDAQRAAQRERG